jgi:hypothetical protein
MAKKKAARSARKATSKKVARKASAARRPAKKAAKAARTSSVAKKAKQAKKKAAPARRAARKAAPARAKAKTKAKATARPVKKATAKKSAARKTQARPAAKAAKKVAAAPSAPVKKPAPQAAPKAPAKKPNLDRPRRTVADIHGVPSSLDLDRQASAVRSGRAEMAHKIQEHTSTSPALTAGDVDADWAAAESVGDEAPGGDNPTPDQDVVDEIGRALGVEYDDDEELQGGDEIAERDRHRWELDPESSDDFEER